MDSSIGSLLHSIKEAFTNASPLANAVTILLPLVTLILAIRAYVHKRLKDKEGQILLLQADVKTREEALDKAKAKFDTLQKRRDALEERNEEIERLSPEAILKTVEKALLDHNYVSVNHAVSEWMEAQGRTISTLLFTVRDGLRRMQLVRSAHLDWLLQKPTLLLLSHFLTRMWRLELFLSTWDIFAWRRANSPHQEQLQSAL
jgi:hypothetical protein